METTETRSAGGVVINPDGLVLVVGQFGRRHSWSLPKGHIELGEEPETAARREIAEEGGVDNLTLVHPLGEFSRYRIGPDGGVDRSERKTISMFLYRTKQDVLNPRDDHNPEARWVKPEEVANLLTMKEDKAFFRSVLPAILAEQS